MFTWDSALFGLVTALIGFFVGNRLAIGRDKRRELKALIDPVMRGLIARRIPNFIDIRLIRESLSVWERRRFDRAVESYKQSWDNYNRARKPDGMGGFNDGDRSAIACAADRFLRYLKSR